MAEGGCQKKPESFSKTLLKAIKRLNLSSTRPTDKVSCPKCAEEFSSQSTLNQHLPLCFVVIKSEIIEDGESVSEIRGNTVGLSSSVNTSGVMSNSVFSNTTKNNLILPTALVKKEEPQTEYDHIPSGSGDARSGSGGHIVIPSNKSKAETSHPQKSSLEMYNTSVASLEKMKKQFDTDASKKISEWRRSQGNFGPRRGRKSKIEQMLIPRTPGSYTGSYATRIMPKTSEAPGLKIDKIFYTLQKPNPHQPETVIDSQGCGVQTEPDGPKFSLASQVPLATTFGAPNILQPIHLGPLVIGSPNFQGMPQPARVIAGGSATVINPLHSQTVINPVAANFVGNFPNTLVNVTQNSLTNMTSNPTVLSTQANTAQVVHLAGGSLIPSKSADNGSVSNANMTSFKSIAGTGKVKVPVLVGNQVIIMDSDVSATPAQLSGSPMSAPAQIGVSASVVGAQFSPGTGITPLQLSGSGLAFTQFSNTIISPAQFASSMHMPPVQLSGTLPLPGSSSNLSTPTLYQDGNTITFASSLSSQTLTTASLPLTYPPTFISSSLKQLPISRPHGAMPIAPLKTSQETFSLLPPSKRELESKGTLPLSLPLPPPLLRASCAIQPMCTFSKLQSPLKESINCDQPTTASTVNSQAIEHEIEAIDLTLRTSDSKNELANSVSKSQKSDVAVSFDKEIQELALDLSKKAFKGESEKSSHACDKVKSNNALQIHFKLQKPSLHSGSRAELAHQARRIKRGNCSFLEPAKSTPRRPTKNEKMRKIELKKNLAANHSNSQTIISPKPPTSAQPIRGVANTVDAQSSSPVVNANVLHKFSPQASTVPVAGLSSDMLSTQNVVFPGAILNNAVSFGTPGSLVLSSPFNVPGPNVQMGPGSGGQTVWIQNITNNQPIVIGGNPSQHQLMLLPSTVNTSPILTTTPTPNKTMSNSTVTTWSLPVSCNSHNFVSTQWRMAGKEKVKIEKTRKIRREKLVLPKATVNKPQFRMVSSSNPIVSTAQTKEAGHSLSNISSSNLTFITAVTDCSSSQKMQTLETETRSKKEECKISSKQKGGLNTPLPTSVITDVSLPLTCCSNNLTTGTSNQSFTLNLNSSSKSISKLVDRSSSPVALGSLKTSIYSAAPMTVMTTSSQPNPHISTNLIKQTAMVKLPKSSAMKMNYSSSDFESPILESILKEGPPKTLDDVSLKSEAPMDSETKENPATDIDLCTSLLKKAQGTIEIVKYRNEVSPFPVTISSSPSLTKYFDYNTSLLTDDNPYRETVPPRTDQQKNDQSQLASLSSSENQTRPMFVGPLTKVELDRILIDPSELKKYFSSPNDNQYQYVISSKAIAVPAVPAVPVSISQATILPKCSVSTPMSTLGVKTSIIPEVNVGGKSVTLISASKASVPSTPVTTTLSISSHSQDDNLFQMKKKLASDSIVVLDGEHHRVRSEVCTTGEHSHSCSSEPKIKEKKFMSEMRRAELNVGVLKHHGDCTTSNDLPLSLTFVGDVELLKSALQVVTVSLEKISITPKELSDYVNYYSKKKRKVSHSLELGVHTLVSVAKLKKINACVKGNRNTEADPDYRIRRASLTRAKRWVTRKKRGLGRSWRQWTPVEVVGDLSVRGHFSEVQITERGSGQDIDGACMRRSQRIRCKPKLDYADLEREPFKNMEDEIGDSDSDFEINETSKKFEIVTELVPNELDTTGKLLHSVFNAGGCSEDVGSKVGNIPTETERPHSVVNVTDTDREVTTLQVKCPTLLVDETVCSKSQSLCSPCNTFDSEIHVSDVTLGCNLDTVSSFGISSSACVPASSSIKEKTSNLLSLSSISQPSASNEVSKEGDGDDMYYSSESESDMFDDSMAQLSETDKRKSVMKRHCEVTKFLVKHAEKFTSRDDTDDYICNVCNTYRTNGIMCLHKHLQKHLRGDLVCSDCSLEFCSDQKLRDHKLHQHL